MDDIHFCFNSSLNKDNKPLLLKNMNSYVNVIKSKYYKRIVIALRKARSILSSVSDLSIPVDVRKVAKVLKMEVKYEDLESSGIVIDVVSYYGDVVKDVDYLIVVNSKDKPHVQRFTIAHEIGHVVLNHFRRGRLSRSSLRPELGYGSFHDGVFEIEANVFAGELLVPALVLKKVVYEGLTSLNDLASIFDVSIYVVYTQACLFGFESLLVV